MEPDHQTAATLLKLAFLAVLAYDVWLLLRPPPWRRPSTSETSKPRWQTRTQPADELYRHGINTFLFPLTVVVVLMMDLAAELAPAVIGLDMVLLLLVVIYLAWPRTVALLADGALWLDGTRLAGDRLAGVETSEELPRTLIVATDWRGLLVRKRVVLTAPEDVREFKSAWLELQKDN